MCGTLKEKSMGGIDEVRRDGWIGEEIGAVVLAEHVALPTAGLTE